MLDHRLFVSGGRAILVRASKCRQQARGSTPLSTALSVAIEARSPSWDDVHDDDLRAVSADLVATVMLRTARVRDQTDDEKRGRQDEQPFNATSHLVLLS
jgi:hypothetical protein